MSKNPTQTPPLFLISKALFVALYWLNDLDQQGQVVMDPLVSLHFLSEAVLLLHINVPRLYCPL
jgi:hypothetical protein